ncbi:MAG: amidophosphoribosyltransferase [Firmicutes bacterium]|nr:amidophosphoribosyltransferase [Bacillota bacterium]
MLTERPGVFSGHPKEECGVFGVFGHPEAATLTHYALLTLQHRGQESAGIAVAGEREILHHKGMGLVGEVFGERVLKELSGRAAIGHVRYSTTGSSLAVNAQPLVFRHRLGALALGHNGNLVNAHLLRNRLEAEGSIFQTSLDTEVLAHLVARSKEPTLEKALTEALQQIQGGYAFVLLTERSLLGLRDPYGIRPLALGRLKGAYLLASESCAFDSLGGRFIREIEPGEMVVIDGAGIRSFQALPVAGRALCLFEFIYFARPDSLLNGLSVHSVRKELGRILAQEAPAAADLVIGVPDSSLSAAAGYAEELDLPYEIGLVKNRYVGRTFIQPNEKLRNLAVRLKLNALRKVVEGQRVVLVDDSIVRGTTSRHIIRLLRQAGAKKIHLRISSAPYRFPCYYGIDTSVISELIASQKSVEDIRAEVGADSLAYPSLEGMLRAAGGRERGYCLSCFTGTYHVPVPDGAGKLVLEEK